MNDVGRTFPRPPARATNAEEKQREAGSANEHVATSDVPGLHSREDAIERIEEGSEEPAPRILRSRTEDERALHGLVRQRVDGREQDRERDRQRELPVERARDAADE